MNITRKIEKLRSADQKKALLLFTYVSFINVMLHMIGFYTTYISVGMEYFIYAIKIATMLRVYWAMPREGLYVNRRIKNSFKVMIGLDVMEEFIYFLHGSATYLKVILAVSFVIKFVLEYFIYLDLACVNYNFYDKVHAEDEVKKYKGFIDKWIRYYIAIIITFSIIAIVIIYDIRKPFWWNVLIFLLACRLYYAVKIVKDCYDSIRFRIIDRSGFCDSRAKKIGSYVDKFLNSKKTGCIVGIVVMLIIIMFNYYTSFNKFQLEDDDGKKLAEQTSVDDFSGVTDDVYIYTVRNLLPEWTGLQKEKYGIINIKTGENTGAIYDSYPDFDDAGIAFDGRRYFINYNGDKVCKIPWSVTRQVSERQRLLSCLSKVTDNEYIYYGCRTYKDIVFLEYKCVEFDDTFYDRQDTYFYNKYFSSDIYDSQRFCDYFTYFNCNDIVLFETDYGNKYGLLNKKGKLVAEPIYDSIRFLQDYEVTSCKSYKNNCIVVGNGKKFDMLADLVGDRGIIYDYSFDIISDLEGNIWSGEYVLDNDPDYDYKTYKWINLCIKKGEKTIFESSLYSDYYAVYDKDYKLTNLIAKKKDSNKSVLIDLNGNQVIPGEYNWLKVYDDDRVIGVTTDNTVVVADLKGNMTVTGYQYYAYYPCHQILAVSEEVDGVTKYNYMNTKGEILSKQWLDNVGDYICGHGELFTLMMNYMNQ